MHSTDPGPYIASQSVHLVGGPLDGETLLAPVHASEMTFDADATYGDGSHRVSIAGDSYLYSAFLSSKRPTFRHHSLPWDFGAP